MNHQPEEKNQHYRSQSLSWYRNDYSGKTEILTRVVGSDSYDGVAPGWYCYGVFERRLIHVSNKLFFRIKL